MGARFVTANGLRFAAAQTGPADGPLALLLHGFPDTPHTWRHLAPVLADAGYRVVTPWMRGYAPTEATGASVVPLDTLRDDVNALHGALDGDGRAILVGHDWGSMAASAAAAAAPQRWSRVVLMAVPPEPALVGSRTDPSQIRRSGYVAKLAAPGATGRVARDDLATLEHLWHRWSPGYDPTDDLPHVRSSLRDPDHLDAVLGYYRWLVRALATGRYPRPGGPVPACPTLVLHGAADRCVHPRYARRARRTLPHPASRVVIGPGLGHFLHLERPDVIADEVLRALS